MGMTYRIHVRDDVSPDALGQRYRAAKEPHERTWWQILWLLARGQTARAVAQSTGYSPDWIGQLATRSNDEGAAGMINRQHTTSRRAPPLLSAALQEELRHALAGKAPGGARQWSARAVANWMAERLGRPVRVQRGWDALQRLRHSPQVPRPRHVSADPVAQDACKKRAGHSHSSRP
jgi:transposase